MNQALGKFPGCTKKEESQSWRFITPNSCPISRRFRKGGGVEGGGGGFQVPSSGHDLSG